MRRDCLNQKKRVEGERLSRKVLLFFFDTAEFAIFVNYILRRELKNGENECK